MAPTTTAKGEVMETAIRLIPFSGHKSDWVTWDEQFLARARRRGYKDVLLARNKIPVPTNDEFELLDESIADDKAKMKI